MDEDEAPASVVAAVNVVDDARAVAQPCRGTHRTPRPTRLIPSNLSDFRARRKIVKPIRRAADTIQCPALPNIGGCGVSACSRCRSRLRRDLATGGSIGYGRARWRVPGGCLETS